MTDGTGEATTALTLGTVAGVNSVDATVTGGYISPLVILATAGSGKASHLVISSGNNQTGVAGASLANPVVVEALDADDTVEGLAVTFAPSTGGATVSTSTVTTSSAGLAQVGVKLGTVVGQNTITASATGLAGVAFNASGVAGPASRISLVSENGQIGVAGVQLPTPLVVKICMLNGNAVSNFPVSFLPVSGAAAFRPGTPSRTASAARKARSSSARSWARTALKRSRAA